MKKYKIAIAIPALIIAALNIFEIISSDVALPIMFICLAVICFMNAEISKEQGKNKLSVWWVIYAILILALVIFVISSKIWGF